MFEYLFIAVLVIFGIQCFYYLLIFSSFAFSKTKKTTSTPALPVSIIICAKNEAENLENNLIPYLEQIYPHFEMVLINDGSIDDTLEIMESFKNKATFPVSIVDVKPNEQFWGSKKYALTLGIKASRYEHLLLTDADCHPHTNYWIQEMASHYGAEKSIILGYSGYKKIKGSFLNQLIRFETILTALQYFSFANLGNPYMGVGRNLSYTKTLFFSVNGFIDHMKIRSGDDDLFVNQVATKKNTAICISEEGFTYSTPKRTFKEWIRQKRRHISTAHHYRFRDQLFLGLFHMSQLLFWVLAILLLSFQEQLFTVGILVGLKLLISYIVVGFTMKKFKEPELIFLIPIYSLFLIFIQLFIFIKNLTEKPSHW